MYTCLCKIIIIKKFTYQGDEMHIKELITRFDKLIAAVGRHLVHIPLARKRYDAMLN